MGASGLGCSAGPAVVRGRLSLQSVEIRLVV